MGGGVGGTVVMGWAHGSGKGAVSHRPVCLFFSSLKFTSHPVSQRCFWDRVQCWSDWWQSFHILSRVVIEIALLHPFKEDHWALPLSTPLSSRWSIVWCRLALCQQAVTEAPETNQSFRGASRWWWLVFQPVYRLGLSPACWGQYIHMTLYRLMSNTETLHAFPIPLFPFL